MAEACVNHRGLGLPSPPPSWLCSERGPHCGSLIVHVTTHYVSGMPCQNYSVKAFSIIIQRSPLPTYGFPAVQAHAQQRRILLSVAFVHNMEYWRKPKLLLDLSESRGKCT